MSKCKARQYSDQMLCVCGLAWDVNDPEPPECRSPEAKTDRHVRNAGEGPEVLRRLRRELRK